MYLTRIHDLPGLVFNPAREAQPAWVVDRDWTELGQLGVTQVESIR